MADRSYLGEGVIDETDRLNGGTIPPMKRFRRWLFAALATLSLFILAAAIGEVVLTRSSKEVWYFHTARSINGGRGNSGAKWLAEFATGGVLLEHEWQTDTNRPYSSALVSDNGQIHHESLPAGPISVASYPDLYSWQDMYNLTGPFQANFSTKEFGRDNLGLSWGHVTYLTFSRKGFAAAVPVWMIGGISALVLIVWEMRHFLRRRFTRESNGFCSKCGYDLRATADRCPECGTVPPKKEITST
jgi:hypothetical protein